MNARLHRQYPDNETELDRLMSWMNTYQRYAESYPVDSAESVKYWHQYDAVAKIYDALIAKLDFEAQLEKERQADIDDWAVAIYDETIGCFMGGTR